jgi:hypothetical protein
MQGNKPLMGAGLHKAAGWDLRPVICRAGAGSAGSHGVNGGRLQLGVLQWPLAGAGTGTTTNQQLAVCLQTAGHGGNGWIL